MLNKFFAVLSLVAMAACQPAGPVPSQVEDRVVGSGFVGGGLSRRGGGRDVEYAIGIFAKDGLYIVCAAANNVREDVEARALRALRVTANNTVLINGLEWAPRYNVATLEGERAACRQTNVPVIEGAEFDVQLAKTRFRV